MLHIWYIWYIYIIFLHTGNANKDSTGMVQESKKPEGFQYRVVKLYSFIHRYGTSFTRYSRIFTFCWLLWRPLWTETLPRVKLVIIGPYNTQANRHVCHKSKRIVPWKLTWNLKITTLKRDTIVQTCILGFSVIFGWYDIWFICPLDVSYCVNVWCCHVLGRFNYPSPLKGFI